MVKPTAQSGTAIEKLLQDRNQYEQWLARLPSAGDAPDSVRQRVRADYEARLRGVMDELRSHGDTISADLERFRAAEPELARHEAAAHERIAEPDILHAVGEFEESKWQEIREEASRGLNEARAELTQVRAEIARLAEVQGLISAPAPAVKAEPARQEAQVFAPVIVVNPEPAAAPAPPSAAAPQAAPRVVPKAPGAAEAAPPGDELAFLKSVTGADAAASAKPRSSGGQPAPTEPAAAAAKATPGQQAKTLKCGECGTLNRPTEWYCERCGAELAAL
jgi:ElaB/YqjD/DUF883 family membrane-anchored ribosome-binding protein